MAFYFRIKFVASFEELTATRFGDGINALCWPRVLSGDFAEVAGKIGGADDLVTLDEKLLRGLVLSAAGRAAAETMLADFQRLSAHGLSPVLNRIRAYPRDEAGGPVPTDVYSFHADSATVETDTYLCTYAGAPSEGIANEALRRKVEVPATRAELLRMFGGADGPQFEAFLHENCFDLHYVPIARARPYSFGLGNLWRIAVDYPGCPVPPCVHRAPDGGQAPAPRLLLIS